MTSEAQPGQEQRVEVPLTECPIGLFWSDNELCLKTEYGNNEGRIDAYIVSTGERFWGNAPQTIESQRSQLVRPVDTDEAIAALTRPTADLGEDGELVERIATMLERQRRNRYAEEAIAGDARLVDMENAREIVSEVLAALRAVLSRSGG